MSGLCVHLVTETVTVRVSPVFFGNAYIFFENEVVSIGIG